MTLSEIYTLSRLYTGTDTSNVPDSTLLLYTNQTYRDLINIITSQVDEDFFYEEWAQNTVIGQSEYPFPVRTSSVAGLKKVISLSIKYSSTDTEYTTAVPSTISNLGADKNWYLENQPKSEPFYVVYDKSISIFPKPTEEAPMILYGISDPKDLQTGDTDIKIPLDFHDLIVLGNKYKIYQQLQAIDLKNDSLAEYKNRVREMVSQLTDRIIKPLESEQPILNHLS